MWLNGLLYTLLQAYVSDNLELTAEKKRNGANDIVHYILTVAWVAPLTVTDSAKRTRDGLFFKRAFLAAVRSADLRVDWKEKKGLL